MGQRSHGKCGEIRLILNITESLTVLPGKGFVMQFPLKPTPFSSFLTLAVLAIAMAFPVGTLKAGPSGELVNLAGDIETVSRDLKSEFQSHYKESSAYRHLMNDVNELLAKTSSIEGLAKSGAPAQRIRTDLEDLANISRHLDLVTNDIRLGRYTGLVTRNASYADKMLSELRSTLFKMESVAAGLNSGSGKSKNGEWSRIFTGLLKG